VYPLIVPCLTKSEGNSTIKAIGSNTMLLLIIYPQESILYEKRRGIETRSHIFPFCSLLHVSTYNIFTMQ
jgi:hypothetical protein